MMFGQLLGQQGMPGMASMGAPMGGGGMGSLANMIAMAAPGAAGAAGNPMAPMTTPLQRAPSSGPMPGAMPPMPQQPQQPQQQGGNMMQMLMQMDPNMLRQILGIGGGAGANMMNGAPGMISNLLASPNFSSMPKPPPVTGGLY